MRTYWLEPFAGRTMVKCAINHKVVASSLFLREADAVAYGEAFLTGGEER